MNFLFPSFLYALSAVSIPILIHLFNFRRYKKLYFSNVVFLQEAIEESRSRSRLKHWLVLLCRILAVIFLVLAFARPYIPLKHGLPLAGNKAVSIFIDNSFSMDALCAQGTLLDEAKGDAIQIAQSLSPSDKVQLVTQDFDASEERWLNKDEFITEAKAVKTSPDSRYIADIIKRQQENLNHSGCPAKQCFLFSDFQKSFTSFPPGLRQNGIATFLAPLTAESRKNLSVDSCWFDTPLHLPGKPESIFVKIDNYSPDNVQNAPVKVFINGEEKAMASVNIAPNSFTIANLSFMPSDKTIQQGVIEINDYPITFDNELYFSFRLTGHIPILWIHPESMSGDDYLRNLYGKDSLFTFKDAAATHIDYSSLPSYRLIILDGLSSIESGMSNELKDYLQKGGSLLVIPPATDLNSDSYRQALTSLNSSWFEKQDTNRMAVDKLNFESPLYKAVFTGGHHPNMDMPHTFRHYIISRVTAAGYENLMKLENGNDFLDLFHYGRGSVYLLAVALNDNFSNFQKHAIFVPTLYNIALYSIPQSPLYFTLGGIQPVEAPDIDLPQNVFFKIKSSNLSAQNDSAGTVNTILPERRVVDNSVLLYLHNQLQTAGNYILTAGDSIVSGCSFNYNRKESDMSFYPANELQRQCNDAGLMNFSVVQTANNSFSGAIKEAASGNYLWKYCIMLALLFFAAEEALLRFIS